LEENISELLARDDDEAIMALYHVRFEREKGKDMKREFY